MAELTPEERARIIEEEKVRHEARKALEAADSADRREEVYEEEKVRYEAREHSSCASAFYGCIVIAFILILIVVGISITNPR